MKKFTQQNLEKFFEDNQIEDDDMFEFLKGRVGEIDFSDEPIKEQNTSVLVIKLKMFDE